MKLEIGNTYLDRAGLAHLITENSGNTWYPYRTNTGKSYTEDGVFFTEESSDLDLVELVGAPQAMLSEASVPLKLEVGQTYLDRRRQPHKIEGKDLRSNPYPYLSNRGKTFTENGAYLTTEETNLDLVSMVEEAAPVETSKIQVCHPSFMATTGNGPTRVQMLHEAAALTNGARDHEYGPPSVNMTAGGRLKLLARELATRELSPGEWEALDMALTKLSRILVGAPKRDTYVDMAAYVAIAGEIALSA